MFSNFKIRFVHLIYPNQLEIKYTNSHLDLHSEIYNEGQLITKLNDKRYDFNSPFVNFPFICSIIPVAPAYEVYISWSNIPQLVVPIMIPLIAVCC